MVQSGGTLVVTFADGLREVFESEKRLRGLGAEARRTVEKSFALDAMARQYASVLRDTAMSRGQKKGITR